MYMKYTFLLLAGLLLFGSCNKKSSRVDQAEVFQRLQMTYDADENKTIFSAQFSRKKENGKVLKLDGGSSVTVNGQSMEFLGVAYSLKLDGLIDTGVFVYTDNDGKSYTNVVTAIGGISNGSTYNIYKTNSQNEWTFGGNPIQTGEEVSVEFVNQSNAGSSARSRSTAEGATSIIITSYDLENLELGYATATTIRTKSIETGNFSAAGGLIVSSRKSIKTTVNVQ